MLVESELTNTFVRHTWRSSQYLKNHYQKKKSDDTPKPLTSWVKITLHAVAILDTLHWSVKQALSHEDARESESHFNMFLTLALLHALVTILMGGNGPCYTLNSRLCGLQGQAGCFGDEKNIQEINHDLSVACFKVMPL